MIIPTSEDYREAERIIRGESELYEMEDNPVASIIISRDRSFQTLGKKTKTRHPGVEAALIGLLLAYDNEGGRVIVKNTKSTTETRLRQRLGHIRRHTDNTFLQTKIRRKREHTFDAAFPHLDDDNGMPHIYRRTPVTQSDIQDSTLACHDIVFKLYHQMLEKYPEIREIEWELEQTGRMERTLVRTGLMPHDKQGNPAPHLIRHFDFKSILVQDMIGEWYYGDMFPPCRPTRYPTWAREIIPLIVLMEQDNHAFEAMADAMDAGLSYSDIEEQYPNLAEGLRRYKGRIDKMRVEEKELEFQLAAMDRSHLTPDEIRRQDDFANNCGIELSIDITLWDIVQRIFKHDNNETRIRPRERALIY